MKNKKGFTLVEIIVSLVLILLVSGVIIFMVFNNKKEKKEKIVEVTKKIQEAAGVYLSINKEIDDSIEQNIIKGGNGYVIPLQTLYDEGYIGENHIKTLKENIEDFNISKHYMLAAAFSNDPQCDNGQSTITIEASYALENSTNYYLCNFTTEKFYTFYNLDGGYFTDSTEPVQMFIKGSSLTLKDGTSGIVKKDNISNIKYEFNGWYDRKDCTGNKITSLKNDANNILYACYKETIKEEPGFTESPIINHILKNNKLKIKPLITKDSCEEGLFVDTDNDGTTFFFRGDVKNNFIKFGTDKNGGALLWRIVRVNGDGSLRLILNENVKYGLLDINNTIIPIEGRSKKISRVYPQNINDVLSLGTVFYNKSTARDSATNKNYLTYDNILSKSTDYSFKLVFDNNLSLTKDFRIDTFTTSNVMTSFYNDVLNYWKSSVVNVDESKIENEGKYCDSRYNHSDPDAYFSTNQYYIHNENYKCDNNINTDSLTSWHDYRGENTNVKQTTGFLTYGEYLMGANTSSTCELEKGYLYDKQQYLLFNKDYDQYQRNPGTDNVKYLLSNLSSETVYTYTHRSYKDSSLTNIYLDSTLKKYFQYRNTTDTNIILNNFRPVINLKSNINITGEGTETNPYVITS